MFDVNIVNNSRKKIFWIETLLNILWNKKYNEIDKKIIISQESVHSFPIKKDIFCKNKFSNVSISLKKLLEFFNYILDQTQSRVPGIHAH